MTIFYPHVGQLRYHDFPKLREIHQARQQRINKLTKTNIREFSIFRTSNNSINGTNYMTTKISKNNNIGNERSFFSPSKFVSNVHLKSLEFAANDNPQDINAQNKFLLELIKNNHHYAVVQRCTDPSFRNISMDVQSAILALQAIQFTQSYHDIDVIELMHRIKKNVSTVEQKQALLDLQETFKNEKTTKEQQVHQLLNLLAHPIPNVSSSSTSGLVMDARSAAIPAAASQQSSFFGARNPLSAAIAGGGAGGAVARGSDPQFPVHVQMHQNQSTRAALFGIAGRVLLVFVAVSAIGAMLDEKGIGRAMGIDGGKNHIQEAENDINVRFDDVKGVAEAKAELEEIVLYLKDPSRFTRLGGKLPRGLLLTGPPGTGKTLLAKAIAGEAEVPFFFSSGSQFDEVYVGLGAKRIRELFEAAKKKAPSIIFIDEIDAVGGSRKLKDQSAMKMTLNELLVQLDGFDENNGVIVIGATNFMESLDPALLRPGRFDKHVAVPLPDIGGRKEILSMYAAKTKLSKDVDLNVLARGTTGFSGADLYNLMNQAALKASIDGLNSITMEVLEFAKDKIMMGSERRTATITPKTAECTAYHEAGHALVATLTDGANPIHKATIMPRGQSLGMVTMLPEGDQTSQSLKEMLAFMDVALGGRIAEELIFGEDEVTSGAMSDIVSVTKIARNMVTKYGFSEKVGIVHHGGSAGEESASEETRARIDAEVKTLIDASYNRVKELLKKHSVEHHLLAKTLIEYETLTGAEVRDVIKYRKKPSRPIINTNNGLRGDPKLVLRNNDSNTQTITAKKNRGTS